MYKDGRSKLYITLGDTDVTVEEEYTLQDFSAIVGTLGGSIGIFLGWSLLDLTKLAGEAIHKAKEVRRRVAAAASAKIFLTRQAGTDSFE